MRVRISIAAAVALGVAVTAAAGTGSAELRPGSPANTKPPAGKAMPKGDAQSADDKQPTGRVAKRPVKPVCRNCGGSCGLEPVCVCEPGTKKKPTTTYSMKCELVCVPAPCLLHGGSAHHHTPSCTDTPCDGGCADAVVRTKKTLLNTVTEEEVDILTRKVEYVCRHCSGNDTASSCASCTHTRPIPVERRPWWSLPWFSTP